MTRGDCWSSLTLSDGTVHHCELGEDHSDNEWEGYHQCECGQTW